LKVNFPIFTFFAEKATLILSAFTFSIPQPNVMLFENLPHSRYFYHYNRRLQYYSLEIYFASVATNGHHCFEHFRLLRSILMLKNILAYTDKLLILYLRNTLYVLLLYILLRFLYTDSKTSTNCQVLIFLIIDSLSLILFLCQ